MSRDTLQLHRFECSTCGKQFESRDRNQLASQRGGRNVFCSLECRKKKELEMQRLRPGRHVCGPCPTCNAMFRSVVSTKRFCSLDCYIKSGEPQKRLKDANAARAKEWKCQYCGKDAPRKRKFCNDFCRRRFFAERFDRFIANPEDILTPQNFDEFLNRDELPCLVEGCDWVGVGLSRHVNLAHGIPADKFKELAGFNRGSGLMGVSARETRSVIMKRLIEEGIIKPCAFPLSESSRERRDSPRPEGREHWQKAVAISGGLQRLIEAGTASSRTEEHRKAASERMKQTIAECPRITLTCVECGVQYQTLETHRGRSKFCGQKCRNAHNNRRRRSIARDDHQSDAR